MPCFSPFFEDIQIGVFHSRLDVNQNEIPIHQNLSLDVDNQKQIKF